MKRFESVDLRDQLTSPKASTDYSNVLVIFACGYEKRSLFMLSKIEEWIPQGKDISFLGFSFSSYVKEGSRKNNDEILETRGIKTHTATSGDGAGFVKIVDERIKLITSTGANVKIVVDYTSMSRNWYCALLNYFLEYDGIFKVIWCYAIGKYESLSYPCVGYGEFKRFSGSPRTGITNQAHFFGLGFDSVRTYGIWNFLDPQYSICLIGRSQGNAHLENRVQQLNSEIIHAAADLAYVPLNDFPALLGFLIQYVRSLITDSDVALVADGPKPLVLAMSIVPLIMNVPGVYCWHVGHVKPNNYVPLDVTASGEILSFQIY